jgi:hypothetical protein
MAGWVETAEGKTIASHWHHSCVLSGLDRFRACIFATITFKKVSRRGRCVFHYKANSNAQRPVPETLLRMKNYVTRYQNIPL